MVRISAILAFFGLVACDQPTATVSKASLMPAPTADADFSLFYVEENDDNPTGGFEIAIESRGNGYSIAVEAFNSEEKGFESVGRARIARLSGQTGYHVVEIDMAGQSEVGQILARRSGQKVEFPTHKVKDVIQKAGITGAIPSENGSDFMVRDLATTERIFSNAIALAAAGAIASKPAYTLSLHDRSDLGEMQQLAAFRARAKTDVAAKAQRKEQAAQATARRKAEDERRKAEAAKREQDRLANNNTWYGRWLYVIEKDVMTDALRQFVYGFPNGHDDPATRSYLRIGCYGESDRYPMGVTFFWAESLNDMFPREQTDMAQVTARFDRKTPIDMGWAVSGDWAPTHPPDPLAGSMTQLGNSLLGAILPDAPGVKTNTVWTAKQLHNSLRNSREAIFRAYPRSGRDLTLIFDLAGYRNAIANFADHCNR